MRVPIIDCGPHLFELVSRGLIAHTRSATVRGVAITGLTAHIAQHFVPPPLDDGERHLAKPTGTARCRRVLVQIDLHDVCYADFIETTFLDGRLIDFGEVALKRDFSLIALARAASCRDPFSSVQDDPCA